MDAEDFLELVWGSKPGWVDLPAKVGQYWVPFHMKWPEDTLVSRRIDSCLRDGESLYFSVLKFKERGRDEEKAMGAHWLWADLDEVNPTTAGKDRLLPTIAWESSPGRYQALWRLKQKVAPETLARINRALSYHLGADLGGWDLTQVLRIPGTRNFKYDGAPPVTLLWYKNDLAYDVRDVWGVVRASDRGPVGAGGQSVSDGRPRRPISARAKALLRVRDEDVVQGERSARLWELECLLAEAGWTEDEIYGAVAPTPWNKWAKKGSSSDQRLRRDVRKALRHVALKADRGVGESGGNEQNGGPEELDSAGKQEKKASTQASPFVAYSSFMAMRMEQPKWLVEGIWTAGSHGVIGGEPKTSKTTVSLALALAVASGKPFLKHYACHDPGPVLLIQEENSPWMVQDRLRKMSWFYGLLKEGDFEVRKAGKGALGKEATTVEYPRGSLPLSLLNNWGFDLTSEEHRTMLVREIKRVRPKLVILDPLYLLLPGIDLDKAVAIGPYLKWLLSVRNRFDCAVVLNHHKGKQTANNAGARAGQRLLGSTLWHGWSDSAIYAEQREVEGRGEGWLGVRLETEFRSMAPRVPLEVDLFMGEPGSLKMQASVRRFDLQGKIESIVREAGARGITATVLSEQVGIDKRTVLSRVRGSEVLAVEIGKKGRGHSHRVYSIEASRNGHGGHGDARGDDE